MWDVAEQAAPTDEVLDVALQAVKSDLDGRAESAWERVAAQRPLALYNLGTLAQRRGDDRAAERWWRAAAEAGDPGAIYRLEVLTAHQGAPDASRWAQLAAAAAARSTADKQADAPVDSAGAVISFSGAPTNALRRSSRQRCCAPTWRTSSGSRYLSSRAHDSRRPGVDASYPDPAGQRLFIGGWLADDPVPCSMSTATGCWTDWRGRRGTAGARTSRPSSPAWPITCPAASWDRRASRGST